MSKFTQQQKEALNTENNLFVIANAGAGKTSVLAGRFADIILKDDINLKNIVAITFTDKAAGELFSRITSIINSLIENHEEKGLHINQVKRLIENRHRLISARISTIHSFCNDILREFPFEAGLDYEFRIADTQELNDLTDDTIDLVLRRLKKEEPEVYGVFRELLLSFGTFDKFVAEMKGLYNSRYYLLQPHSPESSESLADLFLRDDPAGIICIYKKKSFEIYQKYKGTDLEKYILMLVELSKILKHGYSDKYNIPSFNLPSNYDELIALGENIRNLQDILTSAGIQNMRAKKFPKLKTVKGLFDEAFQDGFNTISASFKEEFDFEDSGFVKLISGLQKVFLIFSKIHNELELRKKSEGIVDFTDVLIKTKKVLSDKTVVSSLASAYKFIMIDEYQDTDDLQFEIFREIVNESINTQRMTNLYFVGDPKQSIYMFKGANPGVFNSTVENLNLTGVPVNKVILPHSFRMTEKLALFLNFIFREIFTTNSDPGKSALQFEAEYHPITAVLREDDFTEIEIACIETPQNSENNDGNNFPEKKENPGSEDEDAESDSAPDKSVKTEHLYIISKILEITSDKMGEKRVSPSQIAVLCIKNNLLEELGLLMNEFNIPYRMIKGKGFYQTQVVLDVLSLCEFVLDPGYNTALTALLRSPFLSVSDDQIVNLILDRETPSVYDSIKLRSAGDELCRKLSLELDSVINLAASSGLEEFIRKSAVQTPYLASLSHGLNGNQNYANFEKICDIAREHSAGRGLRKGLFDFINNLREQIKDGARESQESVISDGEAVTLMNIHQSKGLQFDTVFLTGINDTGDSGGARKRDIVVSPDFGIVSYLPESDKILGKKSEKKQNLLHALYNTVSSGRDEAEKKRLFYVALTRAKNRLFLSFTKRKSTVGFYKFFKPVTEGFIKSDKIEIVQDDERTGKKLLKLSDRIQVLDTGENTDFEKDSETVFSLRSITAINETDLQRKTLSADSAKNLRIFTRNISSESASEIISASQFSTFMNCPGSYYLKYILNSWRLEDLMNETLFTGDSDRPGIDPKARGTAIHKLLERAGEIGAQKNDIRQKLAEAGLVWEADDEPYIEQLAVSLLKFMESDIYREILKSPDPKREFEIYARVEDFYIHGIIDLLHISGNTAIIYDYKTDRVNRDSIEYKKRYYGKQLEFYALLVSRLNPEIEEFVLNLVFINEAGKHEPVTLTRKDIRETEAEVIRMVKMIRQREFPERRGMCINCYCKNFD